MFYYQWNIGDYSSHTSRLSLFEDLAYRRLLDLYYLHERPFNSCLTDVARDIGMQEHQKSVEYVLNKFFPKQGDEWINRRADREILAFKRKIKSAKAAGKASGKARKLKASEQALNGSSTDVKPTKNQEPRTKEPVKDIDDRFNEFWKMYDKKTGLKKCKTKWKRLRKKDIELIFKCLPAYIKATPDKQYRKHPYTWLNGESWNDELVVNSDGGLNWNSFGWSNEIE